MTISAGTEATLTGKVAIITGATSGLGAAAARAFAACGANVVLAGRRVSNGEALAAELGDRAVFRPTDVAEESQVRELVQEALERFGQLDCLVNNAGGGGTLGKIGQLDLNAFRRTLDVHVLGMAAGIKHAATAMAGQRTGSIINVASVSATMAGWSPLDYSVAKAAVLHLTRCAAIELGEQGIRVNSISPGPIPTGIQLKTAGASDTAAERAAPELHALFATALRPWQPLPRVGEPNDVAAVLLWLASDASSFVNGQNIAIDGGLSAGRPASASASDYTAITQLIDQPEQPRLNSP